MGVRMDKESWEIGFKDGQNNTRKNKSKALNKLSYESGYIEGKAKINAK